jgi:hypothetical protein
MKKHLYMLLLAATIFWGCQPEPDAKDLIDQLVVSTNYDPESDFKAYTTYAIPTDTIGFISNNSDDTLIVGNTYARPVINAIKAGLNERGYTQVSKGQNPDIGVNVLVVNDFNVFQQVVYPPGYYGGYYGYNSWYYYPYINTYAYNTGVLIIEVVDLKNRTPDNKVRVIWDAYMGDVYSSIDLVKQSVDAIGQAFVQSPYIGK